MYTFLFVLFSIMGMNKFTNDNLIDSLYNMVREGNLKEVECLLQSGVNPNKLNESGLPVLQFAVLNNDVKLSKYLILNKIIRSDPNAQCSDGNTSLHVAALVRNVDLRIVKTLLENGANPNIQDVYGKTPLHVAVLYNNLELILYLLLNRFNRVDPNIQDAYGRTSLHILSEGGGSSEIAYALIKNGASVDIKDMSGKIPLINAVIKDNLDIVRCLVESRSDIYSKDIYGERPISYASSEDIVNCLSLHARDNI